jgi:competence protein ComEA
MSSKFDKYWLAIITFLLLCLISGGIIMAIKLSSQHATEITLNSIKPPDYHLEIYIDGAVANPGFYPSEEEDSINGLIQAAGPLADADISQLKIYVHQKNEIGSQQKAQRINLNRADTWLLDALPGIGQGKAQEIVDYRNEYGPFRSINDLLKVSGISKSTLDNIRDFITVED